MEDHLSIKLNWLYEIVVSCLNLYMFSSEKKKKQQLIYVHSLLKFNSVTQKLNSTLILGNGFFTADMVPG